MAGTRARDVVRRVIGAVTVTALLGAAAAVATGSTLPGSAAAPEARTPSSAGPPAVPTPTPTAGLTPTPTGTEPAGPPGIAITAAPAADGSFLVTETVTLPAATNEVLLRPPSIADAGAGFERRQPTATDLEVESGGQPVATADGPVHGPTTIRWDGPTQRLRLTYRLTQVSVTSAYAKPGRALAAFRSLLDGMPADLPVMVVVTGRTVLSLTCPQLPLARSACGAGSAPRFWTQRPIPFERSRVLVQYDRPAR